MCRKILTYLMMCILLATTGCKWNYETDEIAYVIAVGYDLAEDGSQDITFEVANPQVITTGEKSVGGTESGAKKVTETYTVRTVNLAEARNLLTSVINRSIDISHISYYVIGEKLAQKGIEDLLSPITRYRDLRETVPIIVINQGTAKEFMQMNIPKLEILPLRYIKTMMLTARESAYHLQKANVYDMYDRMKTNSGAPYAVLFALNRPERQKSEGRIAAPGIVEEYLAGSLPRDKGGGPAEAAGMAIFRKDKMVGTLTTKETQVISMLLGQFQYSFLVIQDPFVPEKKVNIQLHEGRSPKISVLISDGKPQLMANVLIEGEITSISSGINYEMPGYREKIEEQIKLLLTREIEHTIQKTQAVGSDVVGFGYYARRNYDTLDQFLAADWDSMYQSADFNVEVTVKIRRAGLMWQTVNPYYLRNKGER